MESVQSFAELGARIRQTRLARHLDQAELAAAADMERTQISKVESGLRGVSALELGRIASALRVSIADLFLLPPPDVLAARRPLEEMATEAEADLFDAQREIDRLWADASQLRDLGLLAPADVPAGAITSDSQGRVLARQVRTFLQVGDEPLGPMVDVAAKLGLWLYVPDLAVEGLSMTPERGFGVAVVGGRLEPGRRRSTAAHEIGHHIAGDAYATDVTMASTTVDREAWIDAFAAELLLPQSAARSSLVTPSREDLIALSARYRVSWGTAVRVAREADVDLSTLDVSLSPTAADFFEVGVRPDPDLAAGSVAGAWVRACVRGERGSHITPARAVEMARGAL